MTLKINNEGLELIKSFEGLALIAYLCPAGKWTIGYGHTSGVSKGQVITKAQAENMLKSDLKIYEKYVTDNVHIDLNENQFSALVSFCYNCGVGNLRTLVKGRTDLQIAEAILLYNKANGKVLSGLTRRRKAERELFLKSITRKSLSDVAKEVLAGKWGNGADRKKQLTQAGYNYSEVQAMVNRLVRK